MELLLISKGLGKTIAVKQKVIVWADDGGHYIDVLFEMNISKDCSLY